LEDSIDIQNSWLSKTESDIIFSSRIRLARNMMDLPFPSRADDSQKKEILKKVNANWFNTELLNDCQFIEMQTLSNLDKQVFLERHLVSNEHIVDGDGKGLIVSDNQEISIMINEEDHLRMQVITSGFNLQKCWRLLSGIDEYFNKQFSFAFLPDLGYLTACPTNLGTAMRASCMMHLPGLILTKRINKVLELLAKISFTIRGFFGEGTQALGNFFQISNQSSLGFSEEEIVENLEGVINQVKKQEEDARLILSKKQNLQVEDSIWRALGILRNARMINSQEALSHLSLLFLGVDLGIINDNDFFGICNARKLVFSLLLIIQPAHLQLAKGKVLKEKERDCVRAEILREKLKK